MGAIFSLIKTSSSALTSISLSLFVISFILIMVLTYIATGRIFGNEIAPTTGVDSTPFISVFSLIFAWAFCFPLAITSFFFYITLYVINFVIHRIL
jgi:hypothetical protein